MDLRVELVRHHIGAGLLHALGPQVINGPQVVLRSRHGQGMTLQVIQVRDGVGVVSPSVGLKHLVDHAESGSAAQ
eukprot:15947454-Heterocapsa_arctica.AAC.1